MPSQSVLSTEWIRYAVAVDASNPNYDPTVTATVHFALRQAARPPGVGDWSPGSWETYPGPPVRHVARILIGPGGLPLARGEWVVWIRVTDGSEVIVRALDTLQLI